MDDRLILKEEFLQFREQCIWLRCCYNTYCELYESDDQVKELMEKVAVHFFMDLNKILIDYVQLQMCKVTDPAQSFGKDNLTVKYFICKLEEFDLLTEEIDKLSNSIAEYRDILNGGRNKIISHLDKETVMNDLVLGEHDVEKVYQFFDDLQQYTDAVGKVLGVDPTDYTTCAGRGDVLDLIQYLQVRDEINDE